jgi:hypothetical protein
VRRRLSVDAIGEKEAVMPELLVHLGTAYEGSWYFIAGAGGDLAEWTKGYEDLMVEAGIGKPKKWYRTVGAAINRYAERGGFAVAHTDTFRDDLPCLLFPLDGLDIGKLAVFKVRMEDRWFDDVIENMRRVA